MRCSAPRAITAASTVDSLDVEVRTVQAYQARERGVTNPLEVVQRSGHREAVLEVDPAVIALADGLGLEAEPGGWDQWVG